MDLNFEQMLAEHNQNYREAEVYTDWMPPDGEYIISLIKLDKGTSSKDGENLVWWKLTGRIEDVQDEQLNGKEFSVGYYTSRAFGILKGAVNVLSGGTINDLGQANAVLEAAVGLVIRGKVRTSISRKNGKEYTNCFILDVINTTPETSVEPVDAGDGRLPEAPPIE
uniref:Uncharacterized protein n=1 Tax=viral metagenome TaxID=1070528 RepID=A0A6M3J7V1_9ZZZZ